jgi:hypothetical protein
MEGFIQIVILICLIVVIVLLSVDKVKIVRLPQHKSGKVQDHAVPDVIGKVLTPPKEKTPAWLAHRKKIVEQMAAQKAGEADFDSINDEQRDQDDSRSDVEQLAVEENIPPDDDRFGQAVSLNELTKVGNLLQQESLDMFQEKETAEIIQKIEGTEFFTMMQQSMEGAAQKIAKLLDKSLSEKHDVIQKENHDSAFDNFDIGDFI